MVEDIFPYKNPFQMPVYKLDSQYMTVDPSPTGVADFYVKTLEVAGGNTIGHFESYAEDYEQLRTLITDKYGPTRPIGGFVDLLAKIHDDNGDLIAQMIVVAAFEDKPGNPRFLSTDSNNEDWVIGKCPPNDRPQRNDGEPAPDAELLASFNEVINHLGV